MAMNNLATTYGMQQRLSDALALGEQALDGRKRVLGKRHPLTLRSMGLAASISFQMNRIPVGIQLQEELRELEGGEGKESQNLFEFLRVLNLAM